MGTPPVTVKVIPITPFRWDKHGAPSKDRTGSGVSCRAITSLPHCIIPILGVAALLMMAPTTCLSGPTPRVAWSRSGCRIQLLASPPIFDEFNLWLKQLRTPAQKALSLKTECLFG